MCYILSAALCKIFVVLDFLIVLYGLMVLMPWNIYGYTFSIKVFLMNAVYTLAFGLIAWWARMSYEGNPTIFFAKIITCIVYHAKFKDIENEHMIVQFNTDVLEVSYFAKHRKIKYCDLSKVIISDEYIIIRNCYIDKEYVSDEEFNEINKIILEKVPKSSINNIAHDVYFPNVKLLIKEDLGYISRGLKIKNKRKSVNWVQLRMNYLSSLKKINNAYRVINFYNDRIISIYLHRRYELEYESVKKVVLAEEYMLVDNVYIERLSISDNEYNAIRTILLSRIPRDKITDYILTYNC
jgi:hypothetical protein